MNMKKLFPEKSKMTKKSLLEFLDRRGFYVVLILCIAIVAATAIFVTTNNLTSRNEYDEFLPDEFEVGDYEAPDELVEQTIGEAVTEPDLTAASSDDLEVAQQDEPENTAPAVEDKKSETEEEKTTETKQTAAGSGSTTQQKQTTPKAPEPEAANFIAPVLGQITFEFAKDRLVYSKTLEDWRIHSGIDIAADRGTTIKAVADGVVSEIKNDPRLGITIVIDHNNGLKTVYSNLASDEMVAPNQKVRQGDIIGCVGNTATFESAEVPHLHFEVLKDNVNVDPVLYLPKSN